MTPGRLVVPADEFAVPTGGGRQLDGRTPPTPTTSPTQGRQPTIRRRRACSGRRRALLALGLCWPRLLGPTPWRRQKAGVVVFCVYRSQHVRLLAFTGGPASKINREILVPGIASEKVTDEIDTRSPPQAFVRQLAVFYKRTGAGPGDLLITGGSSWLIAPWISPFVDLLGVITSAAEHLFWRWFWGYRSASSAARLGLTMRYLPPGVGAGPHHRRLRAASTFRAKVGDGGDRLVASMPTSRYRSPSSASSSAWRPRQEEAATVRRDGCSGLEFDRRRR